MSGSLASSLAPLRHFVGALADLLGLEVGEAEILDRGADLLRQLVAQNDWLPAALSAPDPRRYQQYLLHCDSAERFSIVSFVWAPGQRTPIHDHTVWGLVGLLRGVELEQRYKRDQHGRLVEAGPPQRLSAGQVSVLSPRLGDIHQVSNGSADDVSISIHVYGANIGGTQRSVFAADGVAKPFVSGYANDSLPNIWRNTTPAQQAEHD